MNLYDYWKKYNKTLEPQYRDDYNAFSEHIAASGALDNDTETLVRLKKPNGEEMVLPMIGLPAGGGAGGVGTPGFSPVAKVQKTGTTTTITITDKTGTTTATVNDGAKGDKGEKGETGTAGTNGAKGDKGDKGDTGQGVPAGGTAGQILSKTDGTDYNTQWVNLPAAGAGTTGADGFSPVAKVQKTGTTTTITITDKTGTTTATVNDGAKGDKGDKGEKGETGTAGTNGAKGDKGDTGQGIPAGGTAGQILSKTDGTDYNTQWVNLPAAGTGTTGADGFSPVAKVQKTGTTTTITITDKTGTTTATVNDGAKGDKGDKGETGTAGTNGAKGEKGDTGQGVPAGGTAGQILSKTDGTDYNTQWMNLTAEAEKELPVNAGNNITNDNVKSTYYKDLSGTVIVNIGVTKTGDVPLASGETIATLPTGYRPSNTVNAPAALKQTGQNGCTMGVILINANGEIKISAEITAENAIYSSAMFKAAT